MSLNTKNEAVLSFVVQVSDDFWFIRYNSPCLIHQDLTIRELTTTSVYSILLTLSLRTMPRPEEQALFKVSFTFLIVDCALRSLQISSWNLVYNGLQSTNHRSWPFEIYCYHLYISRSHFYILRWDHKMKWRCIFQTKPQYSIITT